MQKPAIFMFLAGAIMAAGFVLSFYGSQAVTEDLTSRESILKEGDLVEISAELDPSVNELGVYVVQIATFEEGAISAKIFDPFGSQIISETIEKDSFEDRFDLATKGEYRLVIENKGEETIVIGVLGNMPDTNKISIGVTGFYLLIVGLIGMIGVAVYTIKNRRKTKLN